MKAESKFGGFYRKNDKGKWVKVNAPIQEELPLKFLDDLSVAPKEVREAIEKLQEHRLRKVFEEYMKYRSGYIGEGKSDMIMQLAKGGRVLAWYPERFTVINHPAVEANPEDFKGVPIYCGNKEEDKAGVPKDFPKEVKSRPEALYLDFPTEEEMAEMEAEMNPCHGCSFYSDCNQNYHVCGTQRRLEDL
jgi:hypothetical protein